MKVEARQPLFVPGFFIVTVSANGLFQSAYNVWLKSRFQFIFINFPT